MTDRVIPRDEAERVILATPPAALVRTAAVASGPNHHGRAELDLRTGKIVMGYTDSDRGEGREPNIPGRVTLWRVAAGECEFFSDLDYEDDEEGVDVDDLELLSAELHALECPPDRTAEDVLAGARKALDEIYGTGGGR